MYVGAGRQVRGEKDDPGNNPEGCANPETTKPTTHTDDP